MFTVSTNILTGNLLFLKSHIVRNKMVKMLGTWNEVECVFIDLSWTKIKRKLNSNGLSIAVCHITTRRLFSLPMLSVTMG